MTDDGIKEILDQVTSGWLLDEDDDHAPPHAIRHLVAAVEAAERERCAKLCESVASDLENAEEDAQALSTGAQSCADQIRTRA